jgi:lipopolysaccharide transport system permease protein
LSLKDIWVVRHWDLIQTLTVNDLKIKYQHTYIGLLWSLLSPLLLLAVLYFVFYTIRHLEANFAQYLLVGILTWRFFTTATSSSVTVIKQKAGILENIVLPSEIFVLTKNLSALISFTFEFIILIPLVALVTGTISPFALLFPFVHILFLFLTFGLSLILASLYPYFRDLEEIWPFVIQIGFFLCPIIYPISMIPQTIKGIYLLNPVTQVMIMYRDLVLGSVLPSASSFCYVLLFGAGLCITGYLLFKRLEKRFVEVI